MKELQKLHDDLENLRYDLFDNHRTDLKERLETIASFIGDDLADAISTIDNAIDRIHELESELEDAQRAAEEWEEKYNETL